MNILGFSAFYHDSAACLLMDGEIIAAAQEERFTRKKHDRNFPYESIKYCLKEASLELKNIDKIIFYEDIRLKKHRMLNNALKLSYGSLSFFFDAFEKWGSLGDTERAIRKGFKRLGKKITEVEFIEHHLSHAGSAFFPSPYREAAILTIDGVGEYATTTYGVGEDNQIKLFEQIEFPNSLGLLYSAFTYYLGFRVNSDEYKVMGLAPYGDPVYKDIFLEKIISYHEDGSFTVNSEYFQDFLGRRIVTGKLCDLFGGPPRKPESRIEQRHCDIAKSLQVIIEESIVRICRRIRGKTGKKNLCIAGGVALNCVANGRLVKEQIFENIWIQPAAGDAGGSVGAALVYYHSVKNNPRLSGSDGTDGMKGSYLGPSYTSDEIREFLICNGYPFKEKADQDLFAITAKVLAEGKIAGWFSGRMEFGPRALGGRSILADPRNREMQNLLNLKIKFRESFRPFAPAVMLEKSSEYFDFPAESPYMLFVCDVAVKHRVDLPDGFEKLPYNEKLSTERSAIPAVTHVDYSARLQTVDGRINPRFYSLLKAFERETGLGMLVNTSFNVRGEPIVCTPEDAYRCFMGTGMDYLILENYILSKEEQPFYSSNKQRSPDKSFYY